MSDTFKCDHCGGTFTKGRSDEEAMKECRENFSEQERENLAVICDDCYRKFMGWMKEHPEVRIN